MENENLNLSAGIPTYDFNTAYNTSPITAEKIASPLGDGSIKLASEIQQKYKPENKIDLSASPFDTETNSYWQPTPKKPSLVSQNYNIDNAYVKLNDGTYKARYENYLEGSDNEDRLAQQQGTGEKWLNGTLKFIAKTGYNALDATAGTVYGLLNGIEKGSFNAVYNNDFSNWIDDLNTKVDLNLPNYYKQQERDFSGGSLLTANFWADKVLGGMSFVTGTVVSEALWAYATGGASILTAPERLAAREALGGARQANRVRHSITNLMSAYQRTVPLTTAGKALNNLRFIYTSAGYEAGVEARAYMKEAETNYLTNYQSKYGTRPSGEELQKFRDDLNDSANAVFAANTALVGGSNVLAFGHIFGAADFLKFPGLQRGFNRALGIGVERVVEGGVDAYRALNPSRIQRILGTSYNVLKSPFREGFVEEGGQAVISDFAKQWIDHKYNPEAIQDNFSTIDALGNSLSKTYGTSKGFEEVAIGGIIGLLSPALGSVISSKSLGRATGFTAFNDQVREQEEFARRKTEDSDYNLVNKFFATAHQKSATERVAKELGNERGLEASQELNMAIYSKFDIDNRMGRLDDSVANFEESIRQQDDQTLAENYGISIEEAAQKKEESLTFLKESLNDYKKAMNIAESVITRPITLNIEGTQSAINIEDAQAALGVNLFMARHSDKMSKAYANAIANMVSDRGTESALQIETLLQQQGTDQAKQVKKLTKELTDLDRVLTSRNNELLRIASNPRSEKGDTRLTQIENRRQELINQVQKASERKEQIQQELEQTAKGLTQIKKARQAANSDFAQTWDKEQITAQDLIDSANSLQELSDNLDAWRANGQEKAAKDLEYLIWQYDKSQKAFQYANAAYEALSNPALQEKQFKNIFSGFLNKAKKQGADISTFQKAQNDLFTILVGQQATFNETFQESEAQSKAVEQPQGDTLPPITPTEPQEESTVNFSEYYEGENTASKKNFENNATEKQKSIVDNLQNIINQLEQAQSLPSSLNDIIRQVPC